MRLLEVIPMFEKIRAILAEQLDIDESEITKDTNIFEDLQADSLDMIDLIMTIEDEYGFEVSDKVASKIKTVDDVCKMIEENKTKN